jgi:regulatory protein
MPRAGPLSLKSQALALLARREHSRPELRRKLLAHARKSAEPQADRHEQTAEQLTEIDSLLDSLTAEQYLSETRFIESRVHARAARYGTCRIAAELARHGVELDEATAGQLRASELERARAVWRRKFGEPAADAAGRAAQMRFLAGRGFAADVVRRIVCARDED